MTDALRCPRCTHTVFDVNITTMATDREVDVAGEEAFLINQLVIDEPDDMLLEAVCKSCGHARYVPETEWEWA